MRRNLIILATLGIVCGAIAFALLRPHTSASAAAPGPTISIGTPTLSGGKVLVPIHTSGSGFDPYNAFNVHLRWNASLFSFDSASSSGSVILSPFCPPAAPDGGGGGVIFACTGLGGATVGTGLLGTISLTPIGTGCSLLHLFTLGGADGGDSNTGTYTVNAADFATQDNAYGPDVGVNQSGASCTPPGPPTNTPIPTDTPVPPTATNTPVPPTPTSTPVSGAPDVVVSIFPVPSGTDSGGNVSFSILVSNVGDAPATGVAVKLLLPPGSVPVLSTPCRAYVPHEFRCTVPNLAANDNAPGGLDQHGLIATVQQPLVTSSKVVTTVASASAANEPLGNIGNNSAQATVNLTGCPDLDSDHQITILDLNIASTSFGLQVGDPGYKPLVDQNGDGMITIADLAIIGGRFLQSCKGLDSDGDGLSNRDEQTVYMTDPFIADTDGDGLGDGVEVITYGSNAFVIDTDADRYTDAEEAAIGKNPTVYCVIMASDINKDASVNILDFNIASLAFLTGVGDPGYNPLADINGDSAVNILDFNIMSGSFLKHVSMCP